MDNAVQTINDKISLIASKHTWIEGLALEQLKKTAELDGMVQVAGMPDLHPGRGYPIGAAFYSREKIYPALVGNDIGCGMSLWQTSVNLSKINLDKLTKKLTHVESPLSHAWSDLLETRKGEKQIQCHEFDHAFGTIGGGNHFAEFQAIDKIYDEQRVSALGLNKKQLQLLVHSGSRGFGQSILMKHISQFNHSGLIEGSADFADYLRLHDEAVRWAELNREMIARRFLEAVNAQGHNLLDINHNLVTQKSMQVGGEHVEGWLHRKGATPSCQGDVIIPGSRGDYSYLVRPKRSNLAVLRQSLFSLAHGAGRKWQRGECHGRLKHKYKREDLYRTALGSRVICGNKALLYDEAPQAYKKCDTIIGALEQAGLIDIVARLRPVLTFKTHGTCS